MPRHGVSRLPETAAPGRAKGRFKIYPIGYFHIDTAEVRTTGGKLYQLVAIDRTSKFAFVELHPRMTLRVAGDFLRHLIAAAPYRVHTVLTDHGLHFTTPGNLASAAPLIAKAHRRKGCVPGWGHHLASTSSKLPIHSFSRRSAILRS